jgi:oligopeptide/dipeptide ABC transporter ATP-binding protein
MTIAPPEEPVVAKDAVIRAEDVTVHFTKWVGSRKRTVHAVDDLDLEIFPGETVGLVGESGCGKSTAGRALLGAVPITKGKIIFRGEDVTHLKGARWRALRKDIQLVFQDPYSALNPKQKIRESIAEPLIVHGVATGKELQRKVSELIELVGMPASAADKYPHAFSGGQRQRIVIARALALRPGFIVADEATSALDVSIQAQIVNLLQELQRELGLSYLFISHNLAVVRHISNRVAIMYLGNLVEIGSRQDVYERPTHPYTQALLSAVPVPDPTVKKDCGVLEGDIPSALNPPTGCRFNTRCPVAIDRCFTERPPLTERTPGHRVACWVQ